MSMMAVKSGGGCGCAPSSNASAMGKGERNMIVYKQRDVEMDEWMKYNKFESQIRNAEK